MTNLWTMIIGGLAAAMVVTLAVTVTVNVTTPPPPPVPTAEEIGSEVARQHDENLLASRQAAQERKNGLRCGLPGYGECR